MPEAPPRVDRRRVFQSLRMAEELTPAEQATLIAGLEALRDELMATLQLQGDNAKPVELDQAATGRISRIDAIQQQQMVDAAKRRTQDKLRLVLAALGNEDFGVCRRCEEPIGFGRLNARPETPLCLDCAAAMERR